MSQEDVHITDNFVFFWHGWPGQWFRSYFTDHEGNKYSHAEQYMMAQKAKYFGDEESFQLIMAEIKPSKQQDLGRNVKNFQDSKWKEVREEIVFQGNILKFTQNPDLKSLLLATDKRMMAEMSPKDFIWGTGLAWDHPDAMYPDRWPGLNLLGKALMRVRGELA